MAEVNTLKSMLKSLVTKTLAIAAFAACLTAANASQTRSGFLYWPSNMWVDNTPFTIEAYGPAGNGYLIGPLLASETISVSSYQETSDGKYKYVPYSITVNSNDPLTLECGINPYDVFEWSSYYNAWEPLSGTWIMNEDDATLYRDIFNIKTHTFTRVPYTSYNFYMEYLDIQ